MYLGDYVVRDLMTTAVQTARSDTRLADVEAIMAEGAFRHVPIVDDDVLVGLISHRDLVAALGSGTLQQRQARGAVAADAIMSTRLDTAGPDEPLPEAAARMMDEKHGCLLVVEDGRLVGIVTEADFVRFVSEVA